MPPKPQVDQSPLRFRRTGDDVADFCRFCEAYIRVGKHCVPMVIRPWQRDIVAMVWGPDRPKLSALAIGRGNAKSTLTAAMCLYRLYCDDETQIDVLAVDERQAGIIGGIATKMATRHPQLEKRVTVFKDHLVVRGSELTWLPANPAALEGRTPHLVICDEGGRISQEVYEVAVQSVSKVDEAQLFLIGTPGPNPQNVLAQFREHAIAHPEDCSQAFMEFSADKWPDHELACEHCILAANPAIADGGWLTLKSVLATAPPKTSEAHWRRVRLIQWKVANAEPPLPPALWESLATGEEIPDKERVVLAFDGSYNGNDATVIVAATVSARPHVQLVRWWGRPDLKDTSYRIPIPEVEQTLRDLCKRWDVAEIACDSYRWQRSLSLLEGEGLPVKDFPQSISRMSAATAGFLDACRNAQLTHSGHPLIGQHLNNAVLTEDNRGGRLVKAHRSLRIDAAITAVMAVSRATWHATKPVKRNEAWSW